MPFTLTCWWTRLPVEGAVRKLVTVAIQAHGVSPDLHRVLSEQIPRLDVPAHIETANRQAHAAFRTYLERHRSELRVTDLTLATFICATSIEALAHHAVLHRADMSSDGAGQALIDHTTRLIVGYLQGD